MKRELSFLLAIAATFIFRFPAQAASLCDTEKTSATTYMTTCDVGKILASNPIVAEGKIAFRAHKGTYLVDAEQLRTLQQIYLRIGEIAKINANLRIELEASPNAFAHYGRGWISVTTGMLNLTGADTSMLAYVVGHEYAHLSMKHNVRLLYSLPDVYRESVAAGRRVAIQTQDHDAASIKTAVEFLGRSAAFRRDQEMEADKIGTELISDAKFDPEGSLRLMRVMLNSDNQKTGYFEDHPGWQERMLRAEPTVTNQQYDSIAKSFHETKNWGGLSQLVNTWLSNAPDSARAWYYRGIVLRLTNQEEAVSAFRRSTALDPNYIVSRFALCVELYRVKREQESIVCAEYLPKNELFDEYIAQTFKHVVHVGGMNGGNPRVTDQDVMIVRSLCRIGLC